MGLSTAIKPNIIMNSSGSAPSTKESLGMGNVNNTSDINKPISTDTQNALDLKSNMYHTHSIADVTNLSNILSSKASLIHTHSISDIPNLSSQLSGYALIAHIHSIYDITGLSSSLSDKALKIDLNAVTESVNSKANIVHTHSINDITGIQTILSNKSNIIHTHSIDDIINLSGSLSNKVPNTRNITINSQSLNLSSDVTFNIPVMNSAITITGSVYQAISNSKYIANSVNRVIITLPLDSNANIGEQILLRGMGSGGWRLMQNANQVIHGSSDTTVGVTGYIESQYRYDTLAIEKIATNEYIIISNRGTLTIN